MIITERIFIKLVYTMSTVLLLSSGMLLPQTAELLRGKNAFNNQNYEEAVRIFSSHLKIDPNNYNVYGYLINSYIGLKKYPEAIQAAGNAVTIFPNKPDLLLVLAKLYITANEYQKAQEPLEKYLSFQPEDKTAKEIMGKLYQNIGIEYYERKSYELACAYFMKALPYESKNEELRNNVISLLISLKKYKDAIRQLDIAVKLFPNGTKFKELYADILIEDKQYAKAVNYLERLCRDYPGAISYMLKLGLVYRYNNDPEKALDFYDRMIAKYLAEKELYLAKIGYWSLFSNYNKIREIYSAMIGLFSDSVTYKKKYAATYKDEGKLDSARYFYKEIFMKDTADVELLVMVAKLFIDDQNDSAAIKQLEEIGNYNPPNFTMFTMLHELYIKHLRLHEALLSDRSFYLSYPYHYYSSYSLGKVYSLTSEQDSALEYLNISKQLNSKYAPVYYELAQLYRGQNDSKTSVHYYKICIDRCLSRMVAAKNEAMKTISSGDGKIDLAKVSDVEYLGNELEMLESVFDSSFKYLKTYLPDSEYTAYLDRKISFYPTEVSLIQNKAAYYASKGMYDASIEWYNKVLFLNSNLISAHLSLAMIYEKTQNFMQAVLSWKRVAAIEPKNISAFNALIRISEKNNSLNELCNEWLASYRVTKDPFLRERLMEAMHKAKRIEEARGLL